ncbi:MAG: glycosyltransferase family 2 protein [Deltaproteobacteria bacterium]
MRSPKLADLPPAPAGKTGWPWTCESAPMPDSAPDGRPIARISVVTPSYNQGRFIEETIRSVLLQGYPDIELIIMDGGSRDETLEVIGRYEKWISFWTSAPDGGQTQAINAGWRRATGGYLTWLNSDDYFAPEWSAVAASALWADDSVGIICADALVVDAYSRVLSIFRGSEPDIGRMLTRWQGFAQPGFLMRREVLDRCGFLDESMQFTMDFEYWVRLLARGVKFGYAPKSIAATRLHPHSKTSTLYRVAIANLLDVVGKFQADPPAHLEALARRASERAPWNAAYLAFVSGDDTLARRYLADYLKRAGVRAAPKSAALCALTFLGGWGRDILAFYQLYQNTRSGS